MRYRLRKATFCVAALTAVAALSGCGQVIEKVGEEQADGVGDVVASVTVCTTGTDDCTEKGWTPPTLPPGLDIIRSQRSSRGLEDELSVSEQLLAAYRVPNAYTAPESVSSPDAPALTFTRSTSYESGLENSTPSGDDQKWVGYVSNPQPFDLSSLGAPSDLPAVDQPLPARFTIDARFDVPAGAPALVYRPVLGSRFNFSGFDEIPMGAPPELPSDRPVSCSGAEATTCIGSPSSSVTGADALATNRSFAVRELALIGADAPVPVARGGSADVPFSAAMSGSGQAGRFALSGTSTAPGATVTGGALDLAAPGTTPATVRVTVPRSTPNGSYRVTATATRGGQARSASRTLVVGDPLSASSIGAAGTSFAGRMTADGYLPVVITCPKTQTTPCVGTITVDSAGKVTVSAKRKLRLGKGRFRVAPGTRGRQKIKIGRKGRRALRRAGKMRVKATVKGSGRPASVASSSKTFTLRPPK